MNEDNKLNDSPEQRSMLATNERIVGVTRRDFFRKAGAIGAASLSPAFLGSALAQGDADSPFTLGVASGDPTARSVMLWTRLAPDPLNGGGMGNANAEVHWRMALDQDMRHVVATGRAAARARNGHSIVVEVDDLEPNSWYYYQFSYRGARSRIGRTRTFPARGTLSEAMRFALVSCQHYEQGQYAAYRDIAKQDIDFVLHVGDYIYEYAADPKVPADRRHTGAEINSVTDYRNRYALYRLDRHLQDAHAMFPFIVTWDDHEVDNNYAGLIPEDTQTAAAFAERRANAYRVYRETMPVRFQEDDDEKTSRLYRRLSFGSLAELMVLDTRQYRSDQPCGDNLVVLQTCPQILDPEATLLGARQEGWLFEQLERSRAVWNVLAQQVMMMRWDLGVLTGQPVNYFNVDAWDGYQAARDRVTGFLGTRRIRNPVVLTGDIHSSWAADLRMTASDTRSPLVAAEFVCSSISSTFGDANHGLVTATLPSNPHIRFFDGLHRGYALCTVTDKTWRTDFRAVERVAHPVFTVPSADLRVFDLASYGLSAGQQGVRRL